MTTMTDLSDQKQLADYRMQNKVRFVTAASLFDGHDASINIMRRILQSMGCEVIHLGHNRSVKEIVDCALQEDVHGIAVSSYQGGHVEYFKYMIDLLREAGAGHIKVFGGGGGVIVPAEIKDLHDYGVTAHLQPRGRPAHGAAGHDRRHGAALRRRPDPVRADLARGARRPGGRDGRDRRRARRTGRVASRAGAVITALENGRLDPALRTELHTRADTAKTPTLGITGTGGAGKSSLTDELVRRIRLDQDDRLRLAIISVDPTRRKSAARCWATASA
jgi:methylmalonyl-CoA mutase